MTAQAPLHADSDRDVVVSVQDGNYRMVEVTRVTPPADADAGPARAVTVAFDHGRIGSSHRPTSVTVEYATPREPT